jgi:hypothetical protein
MVTGRLKHWMMNGAVYFHRYPILELKGFGFIAGGD